MVVTLLCAAGAAVVFLQGSRNTDELDAKQVLTGFGALVAMDGPGKQIRSLTLSTLRDPADLNEALRVASTLTGLQSLDLNGHELTPAHVKRVAGMRDLTSLTLKSTGVGDDAAAVLSDLPRLEALHLNGAEVSDRGAATLAKLRSLKILDLSGTRVAAAGSLATLPDLEWLILRDLQLSDGTLATLAGCRALKRLTLRGAVFVRSDLDRLADLRPDLAIDQ